MSVSKIEVIYINFQTCDQHEQLRILERQLLLRPGEIYNDDTTDIRANSDPVQLYAHIQ